MSTTTRRPLTLIFLILAIASAAMSMLQSLLNPALPLIQQELHTTQTATTWILTAWALSAAASTPLVGRMGDLFGKKRTILFALGAIVAGSILATFAPSIGLLLAGRVLQGLGGAVFPLAFGLIRENFPAARVAGAVGIMSSVIAVGGGLGSVLAGPIVDALGWRALFWLPAAVVAVVAIGAAFVLPESASRPGGRLRPLGAVLLAGWLVALLLPLSNGSRWGWASPLTIGLFVLAALLMLVWIRVEATSPTPIVDMKMMRLPAVWTTNLVAFLFGAGMFAMITFVPQYVQTSPAQGYGFGASVTLAGLVILPMTVGMAVGGAFSAPLTRLLGYRIQLMTASAMGAIGSALIVIEHFALWQIALACGIYGLGLGIAYAALTNVIVNAVPAHQTGVATGMNTNIRTVGGAVGTAIFGAIVTSTAGVAGLPTAAGYTGAFVFITITGIAATAAAALIPGRRPARGASDPKVTVETEAPSHAEAMEAEASVVIAAAGAALPADEIPADIESDLDAAPTLRDGISAR
ncbi:MFS transporter [Mycetocola saprophilus]|uniref:MFS transporter n=1 Tax=Mycetocola saprophilus TaxID=76636 RepID=UPI003BF18D70